jgi:hypothetical protein
MRIFTRSLIFITLLVSLIGCKKNLGSEDLPGHIVMGDNYYTQIVFRYEKNAHRTTNYRRGDTISINTPVKLVGINKRMITIELVESGQKIIINNIPKHTGQDIATIFDRYLAMNKVDLSQFNALEKKHIDAGTVAKGMRKKAVIVAFGYPSSTETAGIEADKWVYWSHRFNKLHVKFVGDKVAEVVD